MTNRLVMLPAALTVLALAAAGALWPERFGAVAKQLLLFTTTNFGWFYLLTVFIIVIFLFGLAFSRYGSIRLG
ncbi:MAG: BCCT family transporter, partial [Burkholderiales bacterium]